VKRLLLGVLLGNLGAVLFHRRERIATILRPSRDRRQAAAASEEQEAAPADVTEELERLTRAELYRRAQAAGIPGRGEMSKAELIAALRAI
jgi:hypothetical protein